MTSDKITVRQAFIIFILMTLSPAIRLFPVSSAKYGAEAGWIAPLIGFIPVVFLILILAAIYENNDYGSLGNVFSKVLTKPVGKILLTAYLLWTVLLFLLYVRYYAERLVSSLFTSTMPHFFMITMLALVFVTVRVSLSALARFSEVMILVFAVIFAVFFLSLTPVVSVHNILPVTTRDALPLMRAAYPVASIWGFASLLFFLGGHFGDKKDIVKHGIRAALIVAGVSSLMVLLVVGALGPTAAARMPLPFFKVSKLIDIMQSFDRFEAVLASVWVIADFILITVFVFIITNITKELFGLRETRFLAGPVVMLGYAGGLLIASDVFELEKFSDSTAVHTINLVLCVLLPAVTLIIGRVRRKL